MKFIALKVLDKDIHRVLNVNEIVYFERCARKENTTFIQLTGVGNQFVAEINHVDLLDILEPLTPSKGRKK